MQLHPANAQSLQLLHPGSFIRNANHVGNDRFTVRFACLDSACDGAVAGASEDRHDIGTSLKSQIRFKLARIHRFHVGENKLVRVSGFDVGHNALTLLFDQRCAQFKDIDLRGYFLQQSECIGCGQKINCDLQLHMELRNLDLLKVGVAFPKLLNCFATLMP